jgi:hypothetical protein
VVFLLAIWIISTYPVQWKNSCEDGQTPKGKPWLTRRKVYRHHRVTKIGRVLVPERQVWGRFLVLLIQRTQVENDYEVPNMTYVSISFQPYVFIPEVQSHGALILYWSQPATCTAQTFLKQLEPGLEMCM